MESPASATSRPCQPTRVAEAFVADQDAHAYATTSAPAGSSYEDALHGLALGDDGEHAQPTVTLRRSGSSPSEDWLTGGDPSSAD